MWGDIAIAFLLAFVTSFVATPYTIRLAKRIGAVDRPIETRKIHKKITPRLGGLAVIAGFIVSIVYLFIVMTLENTINLKGPENYYIKLIGFFIGLVILEIVCFIDDLRGVPALVKLLAQTVAAFIVVQSGVVIDQINMTALSQFGINEIISKIITIGWIVGITNAINLIDGLDGLSSGISLISCLSLLIIFSLNGSPIIATILVTALAGGIVGFMPFNVNPAKTFIGDTGTNFLGYSLSIISILGVAKTYTAIVLIAPLIILALPICDTIFAIFRRIIKEKSIKAIFNADNGHIHHRLMKKGYTQKQAVFILYGISAVFGMFAIILLESGLWKAISFALIVIAIAMIGYKDILKVKDEEI